MSSTAHPAASTIPTANLVAELHAVLKDVAWAPLKMGWLRITGPDAARWLNGMVTNAINALAPGEGCYNFLLNAQGRILGDCTIYREEGGEGTQFLLETDASQTEAIRNHLDRFIIMDDVELADISDQHTGVAICGPLALNTVSQLGGTPCSTSARPAALPAGIVLKPTYYHGSSVSLILAHNPLVPCFEIWGDTKTMAEIMAELGPVSSFSPVAMEAFRILSGTPRYGVDIRNTEKAHDLPQETAQDRALHFTKGCYLGQEIVERIRSRGSVHRTFTGFVLTGELPPAGTELTTESQPRALGELTSVVAIPEAAFKPGAAADAPPLRMALGYIRREALDRNLPLAYPGGIAVPAALPFAVSGLAAAQS